MSTVTISIIIIAAVGYFVFQGVKNFQLHTMNTALHKKDSDTVERIADMGLSRRLLGEYVCDLYKLRVYYISRETEKFEKMLRHMIEKKYRDPADKQSFLEVYFHTFLIKGNRKYADWLLEEIKNTKDPAFIHYNEMAYAVMLDGKHDLIDEMVEEINSKKYYGFALGVILFMVAKQYSYLGDKKNAMTYYQSAKACFHPKAVYMPIVDICLKEEDTDAAHALE
ncbi:MULTISPECIES: hypothetical protein [Lachnospiraceae]|uniref:Tetratricopeptide repeat protein n=1 Tax=Faecalicatena acetigenes TaxID=2981790 RepID=A0ABT2T9F9_9FIRM|nr:MULTISPECIES: hypothetical protein [Lachnospiraceae]MCU6746502.1 hypothetical protein [Faecalicatena acetigenes]RGT70963.1 hypothetical protein DWX08_13770 [Ruminococcus sp. AF18-22]SCH21738.1 Uncharacterised protein [uncultured Clostridium sp.]